LLISEEYRRLNEKLHEDRPDYGTSGHRWVVPVRELAREMGATSILDYGCGKRTLERELGFAINNYDPAVEGLDAAPEPADLVVCTDVLEHIEPECLEDVLDDLQRVTKGFGFFNIATRPAVKTLADGRNAHLIVEKARWWLEHLWDRFDIVQFNDLGGDFIVIVRAKQ
jgi:hypothetical protein